MRTGRDTSLNSDRQYVHLLDAQSKWPTQYVMSNTQPVDPMRRPIDGQATVHLGPQQVGSYNHLLATHTRTILRASQNKPQTELFGTAPYVALGRGHLRNIDASNASRFGGATTSMRVPKGILSERQLDRFDFIDFKPRVERMQRGGVLTRVGPQYLRPGL